MGGREEETLVSDFFISHRGCLAGVVDGSLSVSLGQRGGETLTSSQQSQACHVFLNLPDF